MKAHHLFVAAAGLVLAAGAYADPYSARQASNFGSGTGIEGPGSFYQWDDGTSEDSIGLTNGGNVVMMNQFTVSGGNSTITSIEVAWGSTLGGNASLLGSSFNVFVWSGMATGTNSLLAMATGTVTAIDSDTFLSVNVGSVNVGGDGSQFFIGASINHPAGTFPLALDQTSSAGMSFVAASVTPGGFNPNNLAMNDLPPALIDDLGFAGNFMIRANAIPTPGALSLFGIAGLAAARRRRA